MTVVTSFRSVYFASRVFGIFPYGLSSCKEFLLREDILKQGRRILGLIIASRLILMALDLKWSVHSNSWKFKTYFRSLNTLYLNFLTVLVYRTIFKYSKCTCEWLNKMSTLYTTLQGNTRILIGSNLFLVSYSLTFFSATNVLSVVGFLINNKFISGAIAKCDSFLFVFLLGLQNVYLCQFLSIMQLINHSFKRINEIIEDNEVRRLRGKILRNQLKKLRVDHLTVTEFFYFVNYIFDVYLLFYIFWSFCATVFCFISIVIFDLSDAITLLLWVSYQPFQNFPILYLCESVSAESRKAAHCLNVLMIQNDDLDIKEEVEIFSLQIQHRPTELNVCGFFNLNYKFFITVSGVVVTYILTFIQFQPIPVLTVNQTISQLIFNETSRVQYW